MHIVAEMELHENVPDIAPFAFAYAGVVDVNLSGKLETSGEWVFY